MTIEHEWWREWEKWRTRSCLPLEAQCALLWAWHWSRPSQLVDHIEVHIWQRLGMPGGLHHFIKTQEPRWMVYLLELAYPKASRKALTRAVGLWLGVNASSIEKLIELRQASNRKNIEKEVKWLRDDLTERTTILSPWDDHTLSYMEASGQVMVGADFNLAWYTVHKSLDLNHGKPIRQIYIPKWKSSDGSKVTGFMHYGRPVVLCEGLAQWKPPKIEKSIRQKYLAY